jgi:hypothetical protein
MNQPTEIDGVLRKLRFSKQVRAFTEHGALMAANVRA